MFKVQYEIIFILIGLNTFIGYNLFKAINL